MSKLSLLIPLLLLTGLSSAKADIRVLFAFDESGHRAHKVVSVISRTPFVQRAEPSGASGRSKSAEQPSLSAIDTGRAVNMQRSGQIQGKSLVSRFAERIESSRFSELYWYDEQGTLIATTRAPDPRVARAPGHIEGAAEAMVRLNSGAWLATGPDDATHVQVFLPETGTLSLGPEQWHISLERD